MEFDPNFAEAEFITKVDNIYIMLLSSLMMNKLERVSHVLSEEVLTAQKEKILAWKEERIRPIFGEMNIKNSSVVKKEAFPEYDQVEVELTARYLEYYLDSETGSFHSGDQETRKEKELLLTFQKKKETKELGISRKCPSCGATMNLNQSGVCSYCNQVFHQESYDWILVNIENR